MPFHVSAGDRVFLVGHTGSGKTVFMTQALAGVSSAVIWDSKHELELPGYAISDNPEDAGRLARVIIRPGPAGDTPEDFDRAARLAFERGHTTWCVDEASVHAGAFRRLVYHPAILRMGRSRRVGAWQLAQRPAWVPLEFMSEAEHYVAFCLQLPEDRKRMAGLMGPEALTLDQVPPYWFLYKGIGQPAQLCPPLALRAPRQARKPTPIRSNVADVADVSNISEPK